MANRLASEKSPYLLQHAANPVDWYPWGQDAFEKARAEQKPIFLSIGYSTCHWCHVMAHESFENDQVAAVLNEHFVSIKVDREERPDVDRVYMTYVQAVTGHGGWPLSAWLTPDLKPFFGGTYYPPEDRGGRSGFTSLLRSIARAWEHEREKLLSEGQRVVDTLRAHYGSSEQAGANPGHEITEAAGEAFEKCFQYFYEQFDPIKGGFGGPPKFPRASNLSFLFRIAAIQGVDTEAGREAVKMGGFTLQKMAEGGIHDHVGGGFHRYSVDDTWFVPHFEKMLYDQAQIAANFLEGFQATGQYIFLWTARDVLDYVARELRGPEGAFYSAEDADSLLEHGKVEHAEGAYYVWTAEQLDDALGSSQPARTGVRLNALVAYHYGILPGGNVTSESDPHGEFVGKNVLMQRHTLADTAKKFGLSLEDANASLVTALERLRETRRGRPRPHLDDKIITAWNGLMVSAFARAAQLLSAESDPESLNQASEYTRCAVAAVDFIRSELWDEATQTLYRSFRHGRAPVQGFAEDYVFLIQALIDLYETDFEIRHLQWAEQLQDKMDAAFWDAAGGGYFSSPAGDPNILLRIKEDYDGAEPAPSSVAAMNLLRLAPIARDPNEKTRRAMQTLNALRGQWGRLPQALPQALCALEYALIARRQVVIAGSPATSEFKALLGEARRGFGPRRAVFVADGGASQEWLASRAAWISAMKPLRGSAAAYVCEEFACQAPVNTAEALRALLT